MTFFLAVGYETKKVKRFFLTVPPSFLLQPLDTHTRLLFSLGPCRSARAMQYRRKPPHTDRNYVLTAPCLDRLPTGGAYKNCRPVPANTANRYLRNINDRWCLQKLTTGGACNYYRPAVPAKIPTGGAYIDFRPVVPAKATDWWCLHSLLTGGTCKNNRPVVPT